MRVLIAQTVEQSNSVEKMNQQLFNNQNIPLKECLNPHI